VAGSEEAVNEADESPVREAADNLLKGAVEYVTASLWSIVSGFYHGYKLPEKGRLEQ
jgi:hypothetical protein